MSASAATMNLDRALRRADTVTGEKAAARLYADVEAELALGEPTVEQESAGEAALRALEERHFGVQLRAREIVEDGHVPNLSRKGWGAVHAGGQRQPTRSPAAAGAGMRHRNAGRPGRQWSSARVNLVAALKLGRIIRRRLRRVPLRRSGLLILAVIGVATIGLTGTLVLLAAFGLVAARRRPRRRRR